MSTATATAAGSPSAANRRRAKLALASTLFKPLARRLSDTRYELEALENTADLSYTPRVPLVLASLAHELHTPLVLATEADVTGFVVTDACSRALGTPTSCLFVTASRQQARDLIARVAAHARTLGATVSELEPGAELTLASPFHTASTRITATFAPPPSASFARTATNRIVYLLGVDEYTASATAAIAAYVAAGVRVFSSGFTGGT